MNSQSTFPFGLWVIKFELNWTYYQALVHAPRWFLFVNLFTRHEHLLEWGDLAQYFPTALISSIIVRLHHQALRCVFSIPRRLWQNSWHEWTCFDAIISGQEGWQILMKVLDWSLNRRLRVILNALLHMLCRVTQRIVQLLVGYGHLHLSCKQWLQFEPLAFRQHLNEVGWVTLGSLLEAFVSVPALKTLLICRRGGWDPTVCDSDDVNVSQWLVIVETSRLGQWQICLPTTYALLCTRFHLFNRLCCRLNLRVINALSDSWQPTKFPFHRRVGDIAPSWCQNLMLWDKWTRLVWNNRLIADCRRPGGWICGLETILTQITDRLLNNLLGTIMIRTA